MQMMIAGVLLAVLGWIPLGKGKHAMLCTPSKDFWENVWVPTMSWSAFCLVYPFLGIDEEAWKGCMFVLGSLTFLGILFVLVSLVEKRRLIVLLVWCLGATSARAQVLTTAETIGAGKRALLVSANHLIDRTDPDEEVRLSIGYAQYVRGLSNRFDLYAAVGETRTGGGSQAWANAGGNFRIMRVGKANISVLNLVSIPLHRRHDASTILLNSALIVSRSVGEHAAVYTGVNSLVPIGARARGVFTPPTKRVNVPVGVARLPGSWSVFLEADVSKLTAFGAGIARSF